MTATRTPTSKDTIRATTKRRMRWTQSKSNKRLLLLLLAAVLASPSLLILVVTAKEEDLYKLLGVKRTATTKEIKSAYRRKALDTHPDKRKDISAEQAAEEFQRVVHAFEILSDENSRKHYDRTGRASNQQQAGRGGGGGAQWGSSGTFHFQWSHGRSRARQRSLKDQFKVQEAMSRVMHIVSLSQLETIMLDEDDLLERNLLMCFVTPQGVEQLATDEMVFPYPFAAMSEQGIWWETMLQTVMIRFNKQNALTRFFNIPDGDEMRTIGQPLFLFGRRGEPLSGDFARIQTSSRKQFEKWVWKQLEVTVEFVNEHPYKVEVMWMHGSRGNTKFSLEPGETATHTTMLTHEWWVRDSRVDTHKDTPGRFRLSKESMVAVWKITTDEKYQKLVIHHKKCIDLSGHCRFWDAQRKGHCSDNPGFMHQYCPLTCKICSEEEDVFKSHDEL